MDSKTVSGGQYALLNLETGLRGRPDTKKPAGLPGFCKVSIFGLGLIRLLGEGSATNLKVSAADRFLAFPVTCLALNC